MRQRRNQRRGTPMGGPQRSAFIDDQRSFPPGWRPGDSKENREDKIDNTRAF
jgi:hypothetical protein